MRPSPVATGSPGAAGAGGDAAHAWTPLLMCSGTARTAAAHLHMQ